MFQDTIPETSPASIGRFTGEATLEQPYILSLDGQTLYHFNEKTQFLEIASVSDPGQILNTISLSIKEGHSFIGFLECQNNGFLIYETGKLSTEPQVDSAIRWTEDALHVLDLTQKHVKAIKSVDASFEVSSIAHSYHHDPLKFLARLSIRTGVAIGEVSDKWAIYNFHSCEQGPEAVILSATTEQNGELYLDTDENPAYILSIGSHTSYDGVCSYKQRVFKIDQENEIFRVQSSPIYEQIIEAKEPTLRIHSMSFNGDLYGSQKEEKFLESGDLCWRPVVIHRLESGYASPERLEFVGACEYYSIAQDSRGVFAFVEEDISSKGVFNHRLSVPPIGESNPLCEELRRLFKVLEGIQQGFSDDGSPREREVIDLKLNLGDEPFTYYAGEAPELQSHAKLLAFSYKKGNPDKIEGSIHSLSMQSEHPVVRFAL